jgi:hypothetical protein
MSLSFPRSAAALLTAAAVAGGTLLIAAPASAAPKPARVAATATAQPTACTVTAAERTADLDQLTALRNRLRGHQPTAAERTAYRSAIAELVTAMLDRKMPAAERKAKLAELQTLGLRLLVAQTPEERTAIRAEIDAILLQLDALRLTPAEWRELGGEVLALTRALYGVPTDVELKAIGEELKTLAPRLLCTVAG